MVGIPIYMGGILIYDMQQATSMTTETKKEYHCFKCGSPIMFINGQFKQNKFGKSVPKQFNMNGTEHFCTGSGGSHKQARERQQQQQSNSRKAQSGYKSSNARYWAWYWGYGPGARHKRNEQRYSGNEYRETREKARERYNNYRQQYSSGTQTNKEEACRILNVAIDVLKMKWEEAFKIIRAAYRTLALKTHPDKGGKAEDFRRVTEAFECLTASKRGSY